jgi:hypothetical protein
MEFDASNCHCERERSNDADGSTATSLRLIRVHLRHPRIEVSARAGVPRGAIRYGLAGGRRIAYLEQVKNITSLPCRRLAAESKRGKNLVNLM